MADFRDTMQVCLNGHVITDRYHTNPQFRKKYCTDCGEQTIIQCPKCMAEIPGDMIYDNIVILDGFGSYAPNICAECGSKFPWFEKQKQADEKRNAKRKIEEDEKKLEKKMASVKKIEVKIEGHGNVVNLGSMIDNVISNTLKLSQSGDNDIAVALENLTKEISASKELNEIVKKQYFEQLTTLSEEALKPAEKRLPKSVLQTMINFGLGTLGAAGHLAEVWLAWGPAIKAFFLG
jgi:hypothetical protein